MTKRVSGADWRAMTREQQSQVLRETYAPKGAWNQPFTVQTDSNPEKSALRHAISLFVEELFKTRDEVQKVGAILQALLERNNSAPRTPVSINPKPNGSFDPAAKALSIANFAKSYSVTRTTVHRWIKNGTLPSTKVGSRRLIFIEDIEQFFGRGAVNHEGVKKIPD